MSIPGPVRWLVIVGVLGVAAYTMTPALIGPSRGPSFDAQRKQQRKTVQERVQMAGGWTVLRGECTSLVANSSRDYFEWHPPVLNARIIEYSNSVPSRDYFTNLDYGPLPPAIAKLLPREIVFDVVTNGPTIVRIKIFGMSRTGGRDIPYYGLWVACGTGPPGYMPPITEGPGRVISKVAEGIFEVHQ